MSNFFQNYAIILNNLQELEVDFHVLGKTSERLQ